MIASLRMHTDSDRPDAFGPDDVEFLEAVVRLLSERL
jgi:putative methionine-R-sulfoxide reductase with GAF domain